MSRANEVVHLQRRPVGSQFSVERLFEDVRDGLRSQGWDVRVRINRFPSSGLFLRLYDSLAALRFRTQVVHVVGDVHYLVWFRRRRGTILTILDCVGLQRLTGLRRYLFWFAWYWWPARRTQHVTTISSYSKREIVKHTGLPEGRITVIPPPLSPEFAYYIGNAPDPTRRPQPARILQIGTKKTKNVPRVIEALRGLDVVLVIVGKVDEGLLDQITASGIRCEMKEALSREELLHEYRNASVLSFVSLYEGFGMPIIEAQACGCPVVTSGLCAMPEAAGRGALIVDPRSASEIRTAVIALLSDRQLVTTLVEEGFSNARRYALSHVARQYAALYDSVRDETGLD